jgi:F0F1-type ATP synthase membrane subunit b/b'
MNEFVELGKFLIGTSGIGLFLFFAIREGFKHFLSRDLKNFQAQQERELERLKSRLAKAADEHRHRYEAVYSSRNEVMRSLYEKIADLHYECGYLYEPSLTRPDLLRIGKKQIDTFEYYNKNKLFLTPSLIDKLEDFFETYFSLLDQGQIHAEKGDKLATDVAEKMKARGEEAEHKLAKIREKIEKDMQKILGYKS